MDVKEAWEKTSQLVQQEIGPVPYHTFLGDSVHPVSLEGGVLTLLSDAEFLRAFVVSNYMEILSSCAEKAIGQSVSVMVLTQKELDERKAKAAAQPEVTVTKSAGVTLNPKYTFETFVVGSANRFARAAAVAVAEAPAQAYNPLFIYGGVGLGKTHLMHAIGHYAQEEHEGIRLLYLTSEDFTNEMITAIQQNRMEEFRARFRNVDILMVDDIQFIGGRVATEEEFFHTFNALKEANKQIVVTSDRPPRDIPHLTERLRSRFEGGLIADIQRPDVDTRVAILRKKAEFEHWVVPDDVQQLIAMRIDSNIRELEGALIKLNAYANLANKPITVSLTEEALRESFAHDPPRVVTADVVINAVADYYSVAPEDITGASRRREVTVPRQMAIYLTRELVGLSLPQIGQAFGGRDHSTILYSCNLVAKNIKADAGTASLVSDIKRRISEGK